MAVGANLVFFPLAVRRARDAASLSKEASAPREAPVIDIFENGVFWLNYDSADQARQRFVEELYFLSRIREYRVVGQSVHLFWESFGFEPEDEVEVQHLARSTLSNYVLCRYFGPFDGMACSYELQCSHPINPEKGEVELLSRGLFVLRASWREVYRDSSAQAEAADLGLPRANGYFLVKADRAPFPLPVPGVTRPGLVHFTKRPRASAVTAARRA